MPSSSASEATLPTSILPDRPLRPEGLSLGMPQSGAMRGKSTNSASITGAPSSAMRPASRSGSASGGRPTGMCALTSAASRPSSATSIAAAVASDCEKKKLLSIVKKPRKKITMASRRARSSSVLSASSITISVTPASRPTMVRCDATVSTTEAASSRPSIQCPGSGCARSARAPRQASRPAASRPVHTGTWGTSGSMIQPTVTSRKSVSRVSRGRLARVWRSAVMAGWAAEAPRGVRVGVASVCYEKCS
ncbi:Secreted protein [Paracidovorax anthurii]